MRKCGCIDVYWLRGCLINHWLYRRKWSVVGSDFAKSCPLDFNKIWRDRRETRLLKFLLFADDTIIATDNREQMLSVVQSFRDLFHSLGMRWNWDKSYFCPVGRVTADDAGPIPTTITGGEPVKAVEKFVYLGTVFNREGTDDDDVKNRFRLAEAACFELRKILFSKRLMCIGLR